MADAQAGGSGKGHVIGLVVVAVLLVVAYVALDRYTEGEKRILATETRGMNMVQALSRYKAEENKYPESLDKIAPKYTPTVAKCPGGENMIYAQSGGEYTLSCPSVVFATKAYTYDSKSRAWGG